MYWVNSISSNHFSWDGRQFTAFASFIPDYIPGQEVFYVKSEETGVVLEFHRVETKMCGVVSQIVLMWKYQSHERPDIKLEIHNS